MLAIVIGALAVFVKKGNAPGTSIFAGRLHTGRFARAHVGIGWNT
jgi:hypothetical protein